MRENDEKLKEILTEEEVPGQLRPENIQAMLDEKAPNKKRSGIKAAGRVAAAAACIAVVGGGYFGSTKLMQNRNTAPDTGSSKSAPESTTGKKTDTSSDSKTPVKSDAPYMSGASSYGEVYSLIKTASENYKQEQKKYERDIMNTDGAIDEEAVDDAEAAAPAYGADNVQKNETFTTNAEEVSSNEHSDTYNQEEGVLEADIAKTDGNNIYYVYNRWEYANIDYDMYAPYSSRSENTAIMNIARVKDGKFVSSGTLDLTPDLSGLDIGDSSLNIQVCEMYIYNDMIEVIGTLSAYPTYYVEFDEEQNTEQKYSRDIEQTFVSVYSKGDSPELIGTFFQEGFYTDVRISPEGCMYLMSCYNTGSFDSIGSEENIDRYIPCCGTDSDIECLPPEDILMPHGDPDSKTLLSYNVISGIDLTQKGSFEPVDTKALAGCSGRIYCSAGNIYVASYGTDSEITRIEISGGNITPAASGKVSGWVNDQFSMSEYNGYFRVATTTNPSYRESSFFSSIFGKGDRVYEERSNNLYVLDMDMNIVGSLTGFGRDESVKSVNFNGDMGYVVTYEQTDPLFAIDISDPTEPFITDSFKINGYSTFMRKWTDGLLLGFGIDADGNAVETGVKLVMFDNSDPYDLKEVGFTAINRQLGEEHSEYVYSPAVYDHKALLIAPEKNLIGVPIQRNNYSDYEFSTSFGYVFYSYKDGKFTEQGTVPLDSEYTNTSRAVYIGDYVYVLSETGFISADMSNFEQIDSAGF